MQDGVGIEGIADSLPEIGELLLGCRSSSLCEDMVCGLEPLLVGSYVESVHARTADVDAIIATWKDTVAIRISHQHDVATSEAALRPSSAFKWPRFIEFFRITGEMTHCRKYQQ